MGKEDTNKANYYRQFYAAGNVVDNTNLSEKVLGFNKHKLVVKKKIDLTRDTPKIEDKIRSQSENRNSIENTIGGFFNSFNGKNAVNGALKFFENM